MGAALNHQHMSGCLIKCSPWTACSPKWLRRVIATGPPSRRSGCGVTPVPDISNQYVDLALPFATYLVIVEELDDCKPDVPLTTMVRMDWGDEDYRRTKKEEEDFKVKRSTMLFDVHEDPKQNIIDVKPIGYLCPVATHGQLPNFY